MADPNYYRTLIAVAEDCPVEAAVVPVPRLGKRTIAVLQYELIAERPHELTQEQVLFECWLVRLGLPEQQLAAERESLWAEYRAKSHPCLRASPLPKSYGWGLLFDEQGRVALLARESAEYRRLLTGDEVRVLNAMRSSRR